MWLPDSILLGPGGIKGFLELGFLLYMENHNLLANVKSYVGVSIGSVIALLIVLGYDVMDIINEASKIKIIPEFNISSLQTFSQNVGIISHHKIRSDLERLVIKKFGKNLTLRQLYLATGLELYLTTTCMHPSEPHPVYVSHNNNPNMLCVDAVILSINIPGIFQRIYHQGNFYVDGALSDPYPIHLLDNGKDNVLGLYVVTTFDNLSSIVPYFHQVIHTPLIRLRNKAIARSSDRCRHVRIESNNIDPIGAMTDDQSKSEMISTGYDRAIKFFESKEQIVTVSASSIHQLSDESS